MQPVSELQRLVMLRVELCRESSESAVKATAIAVLRSLRAETATAKKRAKVISGRYRVLVEDTPYSAGWAYPGKTSATGRRVARAGSGAIDMIGNKRIVNLAGAWHRNEQVFVYRLRIWNTASVENNPFSDQYCFAKSEKDVEVFAERRIKSRIGQYRGMSKRALGLAMHMIAAKNTEGDNVASDIQRLVSRSVNVRMSGSGGADGACGITVNDNLPMAALALKNGPNSVNMALMKAANSTAAKIRKKLGVEFGAAVETPFPEISRQKRITA